MTSSEAERLIDVFLSDVDGLDNVAAGKVLPVSEGTVRRWREGDRSTPRAGTMEKLRRYNERRDPEYGTLRETGPDYRGESPDETMGRAVLLSPESLRRLVGRFEKRDVRSRLAVVNHYAEEYAGLGLPIPDWLEQVRAEILAEASR